MEQCGSIEGLKLQPRFKIEIAGIKVCTYVADFQYSENGKEVIEDCKGFRHPIYILKKKLVKAVLGKEIVEV